MNADAGQTHASLLVELRDVQNSAAWERFVDLYTPLVFQFLRKRGLQPADSSDVAQEVMRTVARSIQRFEYQTARGGFRNWLFTVTRNQFNDFLRRRERSPLVLGGTTLLRQAHESAGAGTDVDDPEVAEWDHAYRLRLFEWAVDSVRPEFRDRTWTAFWDTAVRGEPVSKVAVRLCISQGAVYVARSRVISRLRSRILEADGEGAGGNPFPVRGQPK